MGTWDGEAAPTQWVSYVRAHWLGWDFGEAPAAAESPLVSVNVLIKLIVILMNRRIEQPKLEGTWKDHLVQPLMGRGA